MLGYQKHNGLHLLRFTAHTHIHIRIRTQRNRRTFHEPNNGADPAVIRDRTDDVLFTSFS